VRLLHEGSLVLSKIEANGVRVDTDYLTKTIDKTTKEVARLEGELRAAPEFKVWKRRFGDKTSTDSYSQLGTVVFGKECLGYTPKNYTKTGRAAAGKDNLDELDLPFVETFVRIQNLKTKVLGTYLNQIRQEMVCGKVGEYYVHCDYHLLLSTYRSGCRNPNFQNQPKRNPEMAKLIRPCYLPHPGHHFAEFDFSQLEVRIGEPYHRDPNMRRYIEDPKTDMHGDTCVDMFLLDRKDYDANKKHYKGTFRDSAKNQFVFPQFYGSNYVNCCKAIWKRINQQKFKMPNGTPLIEYLKSKGITVRGLCEQGQEPESNSFEGHLKEVERIMWQKRFKVYSQWKRSWFEDYCKAGGFRMKTGFAVNTLLGRNDVTNYPIQGSAFHCLLWVLIELQKWLTKYRMKSKIIGEIHDALQMSIHPKELQDVCEKVIHLMTVALREVWDWITVPLDAEADVSGVDENWYDCVAWKKNENDIWSAA